MLQAGNVRVLAAWLCVVKALRVETATCLHA